MQKFIIVVPVYNATQWIQRCLDSISVQRYDNFEVVVIDDHSTDNTWSKICTYDFNIIRNNIRKGSGLENIKKAIDFMDSSPDSIIITVDGDDYFSNENVLSYLNGIYTNDIWMTYGQYCPLSGRYSNYCQPVNNTKTYRKSGEWVTTHLRTFKKWLWDKIKDEDLRDENGKYFKVAWDRAFMYPMIEMAGNHCKYIDKVLYIYNDLNPESDMIKLPVESIKMAQYIINKECYEEI